MKTKLITTLAFFALTISNAFALGPLYVDLHASAGYGKSAVSNEATSPKVVQYDVGTTLGLNLAFLYIGATADYAMVNQLTEPNTTFGNRGGTKINLASPTIGFRFPFIKMKFDYQLLGDYTLAKKSASNQTIKYKDPAGYRAYIGFPFYPLLDIGLFYESISYKTQQTGSTSTTLTNKLVLSQAGLMAVLSF
jgi:hypothetical protein